MTDLPIDETRQLFCEISMNSWDRIKAGLTPKVARFLLEETGNPDQLGVYASDRLAIGVGEAEVLQELRQILKDHQEKRLTSLIQR